ncbi:MAG TPA: YhgE/Pip domain-containing protein [Ruminiclostridium sp.]|nr:YhgE/Pip domain-containing protein [Ruminiclostridium sp.]
MKTKTKTIIKCGALVVGVIIIPLLYSFFYLGAFWDPYNMLDKLPVAIVNNDKGASVNGEDRNLGKEVSDELVKDGTLKFVVTNGDDAQKGIKGTKYYAIITLPSDFSQKVSSVSTTDKQEGVIKYEVNQKHNYIASQILKNAVNQIEEKTRGNVDSEVVSNLTSKLDEVPNKLGDLSDGLSKLSDGSSTLQSGTAQAADGQKTLNSGINTLSGGINKAADGSNQLYSAVTGKSGLPTLTSGVQQLSEGSKLLLGQFSSSGSSDLTKQTIFDGVTQLNAGSHKLLNYFSYTGSTDPKSMTLTDAVTQVDGGVQELYNKLKYTGSTDEKSMTATDGAVLINSKAQEITKGASNYTLSVDSTLYTMITANKTVSQSMLTGYSTQLNTLLSASPEIQYANADKIKMLANLVTIYSVGLQAPDVNTFEKTLTTMGQNDPTKQSVVSAGASLNGGLTQFSQKTDSYASSLNNAVMQQKLQALSNGSTQLKSQFYDKGDLKSGVQGLADGTQKLSAQFDNDGQFKTGFTSLDNGIQTLYGGTGSLGKLTSSIQALSDGLKQLQSGSTQLVSGSSQLVSASEQINTGASKLNDGISTAKSGVSDSISDANSQLDTAKGLDSYAKTPVTVKSTELNPLPNYGSAFAPYFMSLSLWVGALLIFFGIYLDADERIKVLSRHSDNKILRVIVFALIGVAQALALALIVQFALGLSICNVPAFYLSCIIVSIVFISIVEFLIVNFKDIGKFLSLAFLVLQLTSNGGTFPMETVPKFFNVLYPFMPMTYSVNLFKEVTVNYNSANANRNIAVLLSIFAVFTALTILFSLTRKAKVKISEKLQAEQ